MRRRLATALVAAVLVWLPSPVTPQPVAHAASACTGWTNTLVPPPTIRVLRTSGTLAGKVQVVDFQAYVENTISWEYVSTWPAETLRSGAVAIKEYGWYFTMHYRGGTAANGSCWDVRDDTYDQRYDEGATPSASEIKAVHDTWLVSVKRNGSEFVTGYWAGAHVACGSDADGIRIYQWSTKDCGSRGYTMTEILQLYYGPGVDVRIPTVHPMATFPSAPAGRQVTVGSSPSIGWIEETPAGSAIAARSLTLVSTQPAGGVCPSSGWLPVAISWANGGKSPQTLANLQAGRCYWLFVALTDASGRSSTTRSGAMLVDPAAPVATFTAPVGRVSATSSTTVSWKETPAAGTTIASRTLTEETAEATRAGSCANASWHAVWSKSLASPVSATGLGRLTCYRWRMTLKDSRGHTGTWYSGEVATAG